MHCHGRPTCSQLYDQLGTHIRVATWLKRRRPRKWSRSRTSPIMVTRSRNTSEQNVTMMLSRLSLPSKTHPPSWSAQDPLTCQSNEKRRGGGGGYPRSLGLHLSNECKSKEARGGKWYRCPYCESRRTGSSNMRLCRLQQSIYSCSKQRLWSRQSSSVASAAHEGCSGAHIRRTRSNERNANAVFAVICQRSRTGGSR